MMTSQRSTPLNLAFLGCGHATEMHSRTIARVERNLRLHYASRDGERASRFRARFKGAGTFSSYDAAISDPQIQVVLVATPPSRHLELTIEALEAGKDVIVEKPAYLRVEDFRVVRETAARCGQRVFVAENYYYKPLRARLIRLLQEGVIGDPLFIRVNAVKHQIAEGWRADPDQAGGGGLFEGGIHWVNFMANLGSEVRSVTGFAAGAPSDHMSHTSRPRGAESLHLVFEYANGAVGSLAFSWEVPSALGGVHLSKIYGRAGAITFESNGIFLFVRGSRTRVGFPGIRDLAGYGAMFTDFFTALRTGQHPQMTLDKAETDVRLVQQAYRSLGRTDLAPERREDDASPRDPAAADTPPQVEGT